MKRRNPIARDLRTAKYKKRVVESKKVYTRAVKHRKKELGENKSNVYFNSI